MSFISRVAGLTVGDKVRRSSGAVQASDQESEPRTDWRDFISHVTWEHLRTLRRSWEVLRLEYPSYPAARETQRPTNRRKWRDGVMLRVISCRN